MSDKCVHTEHCCKKHGCKYNDYNCPVAFGDKPQSFPCEWCLEDRNNPLQERIQQLEDAHKANVHQELRTDYTERGHRCEWRVAYEAVQQRSKAALLKENDNG